MLPSTSVVAISVVVALAFGVTWSGSGVARAQQGAAAQASPQPQQPSMQDMMKMHGQMMADMKAGDAKLDALIKEMNEATGNAKVNAIAAVMNELVQQHKAMHGRMGQMHEHMMGMGGMMMRR